jgi:hypothetical protein
MPLGRRFLSSPLDVDAEKALMVDPAPPPNPDRQAAEFTEHLAHRPSWDCRQCLKPWPCDPAREAFVTTLNSVERAILMWTYLEVAAEDIRETPLDEIFTRFIRWTG